MKKRFKFLVGAVVGLLVVINSNKGQAQAISYYPWRDVMSISTNPTKKIWMDFRLQTNSVVSSGNTEPVLMVTIAKRKNASFYAGVGAYLGILEYIYQADSSLYKKPLVRGYVASVGTRVYPFEKYPKLSVNFELSPYVSYDRESGSIRAFFGLGYNFGGK